MTAASYESLLKDYREQLDNLTKAFDEADKARNSEQKKKLEVLEITFFDVLLLRDKLQEKLTPEEEENPTTGKKVAVKRMVPSSKEIAELAQSDSDLYMSAMKIFNQFHIPLAHAREMDISPYFTEWWWQFDNERYCLSHAQTYIEIPGKVKLLRQLRILAYFILALAILVISFQIIYLTAELISQIVLRILVRIDADSTGLDLITVIAIAAQLLVGGRLVFVYVNRLTDRINHAVGQYAINRRLRWLALKFIPVTRFFVGTLIFVLLITMSNLLFFQPFINLFAEAALEAQQPLETRQSSLEFTSLLGADEDFAVELARIGLRYEDFSDMEKARDSYRQALEIAPDFVYMAYRLADTYIQGEQLDTDGSTTYARQDLVLSLLDEALNSIESYDAGRISLDNLRLTDDYKVTQVQLLLHSLRAQVFLIMGESQGARYDIEEGAQLILANPNLFITSENEPEFARLESDETTQIPITSTRFAYWAARIYDALAAQSNNTTYASRAREYWRELAILADSRSSTERLWLLEANSHIAPPPMATPSGN